MRLRADPAGSCFTLHLTKPGPPRGPCQWFPCPVSTITCLQDQLPTSSLSRIAWELQGDYTFKHLSFDLSLKWLSFYRCSKTCLMEVVSCLFISAALAKQRTLFSVSLREMFRFSRDSYGYFSPPQNNFEETQSFFVVVSLGMCITPIQWWRNKLVDLLLRTTPPLMFMILLFPAFLSQSLPFLQSLPVHWYVIFCLKTFSNIRSMPGSKMILKNIIRENERSWLLEFLGTGTDGIGNIGGDLDKGGHVTGGWRWELTRYGDLGKDRWNIGHDASWSHTLAAPTFGTLGEWHK